MLANNIKKYRQTINATQEEMATQIGIGRTALSRIENGAYSPSAKTMKKISDYFNLPIGDIFFNTDVSKNNTKGVFETDQYVCPTRGNE
ncbi:helix-turn-helix transcriptional regulator [Sporosarcina sp. E16_3]|uniref:helix-turn-helix transcriptional regulator n=1 Tax=Sporosarcina sp. E16_3 TaxID=2789293 RepID=UPI001A92D3E5|nr:helix-turn-helix transcriptional regulator [Sporosarcina sp. E16_3]MBO0602529.1 helix-turn-helix transcriptional regulator [Sporosarcina sp. E16_3]